MRGKKGVDEGKEGVRGKKGMEERKEEDGREERRGWMRGKKS